MWAKKDGKYGLLDLNGKLILPFVFDQIQNFINGVAVCATQEPEALTSATNMVDTAPAAPVTIELSLAFVSQHVEGSTLHLTYRFVNKGEEAVTILKPQSSFREFGFNPKWPMSNPAFFHFQIIPSTAACAYAPLMVDMGSESTRPTIPFKRTSDFATIPPHEGTWDFTISIPHFKKGICDTSRSEVRVKLVYRFDKRYLEQVFFNNRLSQSDNISVEEARTFYEQLKKPFRGEVISNETQISLK